MELERRYITHDPHAAGRRRAEDRAALDAFEASELDATLVRLSNPQHAATRSDPTDPARNAAIEPRRNEMATTTDTPTGLVPATIIKALGLPADAPAQDVLKRVQTVEGAARDTLTHDELGSIAAVRTALGLPTSATTAEVLDKLRGKLVFARSGGTSVLVFGNRHRGGGDRADMAIATSILTALGLPADAAPDEVLAKVRAIEDERKQAETDATNEAHALGELRNLLGLDATATDDDVVAAIRDTLAVPAMVDRAVLARKIHPSGRQYWERAAAKDRAAFAAFLAAAPAATVRADEIVADMARERVRWRRGRLDFPAAMNEVAREHPELATTYRQQMQRQTRTNGSD